MHVKDPGCESATVDLKGDDDKPDKVCRLIRMDVEVRHLRGENGYVYVFAYVCEIVTLCLSNSKYAVLTLFGPSQPLPE